MNSLYSRLSNKEKLDHLTATSCNNEQVVSATITLKVNSSKELAARYKQQRTSSKEVTARN